MISREEWNAAYRGVIAEQRAGTGEVPTFEEVEALSRGELPDSEAERVRAALALYPDLLRVLTEPFHPQETGVLSDEELETDLAKIRERVRRTAPRPVPFPERRFSSRALALAAGLIIVIALGTFAVRQMSDAPRQTATLELYPDGVRGGDHRGAPVQAPAQLSTDTDYLLQPAFTPRGRYSEYHLELLDLTTEQPRRVWMRERVTRQPDDTYPVNVDTQDLEPGLYRLVLYGVNGTAEPLAEYTLRVSTR